MIELMQLPLLFGAAYFISDLATDPAENYRIVAGGFDVSRNVEILYFG
jgi:hypothetical protein